MSLTDQERKVAMMLAEVWNEYMALPEQSSAGRAEFCEMIHRCQDHVLARPGVREINGIPEPK